MIEQTYGPRRCRDSRKPPLSECPDTFLYRCPVCGAVFTVSSFPNRKADEGSRQIRCCGETAERLVPKSLEEASLTEILSYKITGGYNDNAVQVSWKAYQKELIPEWIYLKTFTGGYLKHVFPGKRPPMIFALADLDAFAYCDEDPCLECTFRCKRGFIIYSYIKEKGLIEIPLDKMNPYWQSDAQ
ncbi:MAG: hypothetical protein PHV18_12580 [Lachnospiraceae bacterium]|nr:hypothetical protein [Lachnospiraceae bacterium]